MLNKEDVRVLRGMFGEVLGANNHVLKREIRDEMRALLVVTEKKIISEVTEFIGGQILPQIDECQRDIVQLKIVTNIA